MLFLLLVLTVAGDSQESAVYSHSAPDCALPRQPAGLYLVLGHEYSPGTSNVQQHSYIRIIGKPLLSSMCE